MPALCEKIRQVSTLCHYSEIATRKIDHHHQPLVILQVGYRHPRPSAHEPRPVKIRRFSHRKFIILAINYFTKWAEAVPMKSVDQQKVIGFINEYIVYRFGLPQTIIVDQWTMFTGAYIIEFAFEHGVHMLNSSPYLCSSQWASRFN